MYEDKIDEVNKRLSDIQRATVDYLDRRMFEEGQNRMLVADDVGLGKTWVAKGVIARAYKRWLDSKPCKGSVILERSEGTLKSLELSCEKPYFNIYYICSNQQLAAQNLSKLNFTKDAKCIVSQVSRISMLALKPSNENVPVKIYSLTPETSFNPRSQQGIKAERYIIYNILSKDNSFDNERLSSFLKGSNDGIYWDTDSNENSFVIRDEIGKKYIDILQTKVPQPNEIEYTRKNYSIVSSVNEKPTVWNILECVLSNFDRKNVQSNELYNEVIGLLRGCMIEACLSLLDANIYIMDEFQRYSKLLDNDNGKSELSSIASKVFNQDDVKVLMLSATPFKSFTNRYDEVQGEQHYKELQRVLRFLYKDADADWDGYERSRRELYRLMLNLNNSSTKDKDLEEIARHKKIVEDFYYRVMVRTEKIIASEDPNAMIKHSSHKPLAVTAQEIKDFVNLDKVFKAIYEKQGKNAPAPVDYFKSAPYSISFLRDYKIGDKAVDSGKDIDKILRRCKGAFVDIQSIQTYTFPKQNQWPNAKLRILMNGLEKESRLLWCPPTVPYYPMEGAYKGQENFTKTLVFSAWKLVPRMIATLVSYESEKQSLGKLGKTVNNIKYFVDKRASGKGDEARKPSRLLVFTKNKNNMTTLLLAYPSPTIANITDPLANIKRNTPLSDIISSCCDRQKSAIKDICNNYGVEEDNEWSHIYWAYPIICDSNGYNGWVERYNKDYKGKGEKESLLTKKYIPELEKYLKKEKNPSFPKNPKEDEIEKVTKQMAWLSVGSPAICAYRALRRYFDDEKLIQEEAFRIGLSFIDLFNKPESIAVVNLQYPNDKLDYWQKVIRYCAEGNLQAVLDEYLFMLLNDCEKIEDVSDRICSVVGMRTAQLKVDDASSFNKKDDDVNDGRHYMRTHYAAAFGVNTKKSEAGNVRATGVREAFNSPFRPFVLATTSIGQEGLDFHWYCRRIMHWNMPNNPIDFEQREGRINRYRGKVIRQRVANKYKDCLPDEIKRPWDELFDCAKAARKDAKIPCDIVPNWHFDSDDVEIERVVPIYQFSEDIQRYEKMKQILGMYRLTFGQPRQEELIEALNCVLSPKEIDKLLINLCPLKRGKENTNDE